MSVDRNRFKAKCPVATGSSSNDILLMTVNPLVPGVH